MDELNRRGFLRRTAKTVVSLSAGASVLAKARRADAANDKIVVGLIGCGGRGRGHGRAFAQYPDTELTYCCDPDLERIGNFPSQIEHIQKKRPEAVQDMRRIFDDKDVDAVVVATCDHWHALATVWACQAGKDVYVEKPASNNVWEGRKMVEAARKYERIVQTGTQNRSAPYVAEALEYIQSGELGDIPLLKVYNLKPGGPFNRLSSSASVSPP